MIVHTYPHPYLEDRPNVDPREVLGARTPISIVPNQGIGGYLLSINVHALVRIAGRVDGRRSETAIAIAAGALRIIDVVQQQIAVDPAHTS